MKVLTLRALNRATLARQMLLAREEIDAVSAVERLAGMQAQIPRPPFVGLWTRMRTLERETLATLLREKKLVRATSMRGTIHVMSAEDFVAFRATLQPMLSAALQSIVGKSLAGVDLGPVLEEARAWIEAKPMTFDALRGMLRARFPAHDERALAFAVRTKLPLVQVPTEATWAFPAAADFAVAEQWIGRAIVAEPDAKTLVKRYLATFGPATPADAQTWSGVRGMRDVFAAMREELVVFRDERKRELFDLPDAPRPDEDTVAPVRFLPDFDNLTLSHDDRTRVIADAHRSLIATKNLLVRPIYLVDGFVAGWCKIDRKKDTASLQLMPFAKLTKKTLSALEEEGDAMLRWIEPDATKRAITVAKG